MKLGFSYKIVDLSKANLKLTCNVVAPCNKDNYRTDPLYTLQPSSTDVLPQALGWQLNGFLVVLKVRSSSQTQCKTSGYP